MRNHPLFGRKYFKMNFHIFSVFEAQPLEWWLYARHEATHAVTFLGKIKKGITELCNRELSYSTERGRDKLFDIAVEQFKVLEHADNMMNKLERRTDICYDGYMPNEKVSRNRKIIQLIEKGVSYRRVGEMMGIKSTGTLYKIYWRDKDKYSKKVINR